VIFEQEWRPITRRVRVARGMKGDYQMPTVYVGWLCKLHRWKKYIPLFQGNEEISEHAQYAKDAMMMTHEREGCGCVGVSILIWQISTCMTFHGRHNDEYSRVHFGPRSSSQLVSDILGPYTQSSPSALRFCVSSQSMPISFRSSPLLSTQLSSFSPFPSFASRCNVMWCNVNVDL